MRSPLYVLTILLTPLAAYAQGLNGVIRPPETEDRAGQPGFATMMADVGDVDGDGYPDLAVSHAEYVGQEVDYDGETSYDYTVGGSVYVYSGRSGEVVRTSDFPRPADGPGHFGRSLVRVGDIDGDGTDDLAVGAPGDGPVRNGMGNRTGSVHFVMTGTGEIRPAATLFDRPDVHGLGLNLLAPGDLDGDGAPDVVDVPFSVQGASGSLFAFSGRDGHLIYERSARGGFTYRPSGTAVDDVDGDGVGDLVVVAASGDDSTGERTEAVVLSGADGSYVRPITVGYAGAGLDPEQLSRPFAVRTVPDIDGDGNWELVFVLRKENPSRRPAVVVVSGQTGAVIYDLPVSDGIPASNTPVSKSVSLVGDLDGDGARDLAVFNRGPGVEVFSLATGERVWRTNAGGVAGSGFGWETSVADCSAADGRCVLVVGDPSASESPAPPQGRVFVYGQNAVATEPEPVPSALRAWPNPAADRVQITWGGGVRSVRVFDGLGRIVGFGEGAGRYDLDTSGLNPGVYLVVAEGPDGTRAVVQVTVAR